jgi:hypothetical protein
MFQSEDPKTPKIEMTGLLQSDGTGENLVGALVIYRHNHCPSACHRDPVTLKIPGHKASSTFRARARIWQPSRPSRSSADPVPVFVRPRTESVGTDATWLNGCVCALGVRASDSRPSFPFTTSPAAALPLTATLSTADDPSPRAVLWPATVALVRRARPAGVESRMRISDASDGRDKRPTVSHKASHVRDVRATTPRFCGCRPSRRWHSVIPLVAGGGDG